MDTVGSTRERADAAAREPAAAQRGRRRRPPDVRAVVALPGAACRQAGLRARLSHRIRRRQAHAGLRHRGRDRVAHRWQLRREVQGGRTPLLRIVRLLRRARRDDPQRELLLRDRSAASRTSGASRCCASTGNGRSTSCARQRTCRRPSPTIIEAMGGRAKGPVHSDGAKAIAPGGSIIHEVGGAIMGADREGLGHQSVVARPGTCRTCSSPMAPCSPRTPTRIRRSPSWRWPGGWRITFSSACAARSCDGSAYHHEVGAGRKRRLAAGDAPTGTSRPGW